MKPVRRLWFRIETIARAVIRDLFGEGDEHPGPGAVTRLSGLADPGGLAEMQSRLDGLAPELGALSARHKQLEVEQRRAVEELARLDAEIDAAVQQGQDGHARDLLAKRMAKSARLDDLTRRCEETAQALAGARADIETLRARLVEARRQSADLASREQSAAALENMARLRRELDRDLARLQDDFARRDELAAKTEDRVAALKDLEKRR